MPNFSSFHPKHIKEAVAYGQALCNHRNCSDEEERDRHLKILKDALIRSGYDAQLNDCQFQCATAKKHNDLFRRQTEDMTDRVPFIIEYIPREERLNHVLRSLQHVIEDDKHFDNIDHSTIQPCHGNLCKACQIFDMDTIITCGNTTHYVHGRYSCDSANVVYLICCKQGYPEAWYVGKTMQTLQRQMNGHCTTIARQECFLPVGKGFSGQGHPASGLR
eukprot:g29459.t1